MLMGWTNFHSHSHYCDGSDAPEAYIQEAIRRGFATWGLSSHAPIPFASSWNMKAEDLPRYHNEATSLKRTYEDQISFLVGLEVDYIPGHSGCELIRKGDLSFDYLIGSVHFVDFFGNGNPWEIDGRHQVFLKGLDEIFGGNVQKAIERYFELTRKMVIEDRPDLIGHLDKIRIQSENGQLFNGNEEWYQNAIMATLETIRDEDLIVEINTRGVYKGLVREPYPQRWVLEEMKNMGIRMTLCSDAHHPREVNGSFPETAQLLREVGYCEMQVLHHGEWIPCQFDRWGVRVPDGPAVLTV